MDGVPEPVEEVVENDPENPMDLIDQLIETFGCSREDAQRILDENTTLLEKADKFDAIPEPDLDAEKAARVADRKERRDLVTVATELKLDAADDFDIDALDNTELKSAILVAAKAPEVKFDGLSDDDAVRARFASFLAFRGAEDRTDSKPEVHIPASDLPVGGHRYDAWGK